MLSATFCFCLIFRSVCDDKWEIQDGKKRGKLVQWQFVRNEVLIICKNLHTHIDFCGKSLAFNIQRVFECHFLVVLSQQVLMDLAKKYHWLQFLLSKAFCIYELLGETLKRNKFIFFNERYRHEISPVDYLH